jgi:hypothetical protein
LRERDRGGGGRKGGRIRQYYVHAIGAFETIVCAFSRRRRRSRRRIYSYSMIL